jgi:hypothetical protein
MLEKIIKENQNSDWFSKPIKWKLNRYIVGLTDNINPTIEQLEHQLASFSQLDNIHIWGWLDTKTNINYIDIWTSLNNLDEAKYIWKLFNQKAIFDIETFNEIRL